MNFLLSAGEASGDTYGAQLADALRYLAPAARFFGMGGEKMSDAGCDLLVHANEVAVVGLAEVVTHLPAIRRRFKHLVAEAARRKPDAAVLIDFPDFNLRLARELHRLDIPVFYFVSPQIWAWRTGRVKQIRKYVSKMIVIFPFEREFYRRHGVEVSYVGHPLAYAATPQISREEFAAKYQLDPRKQWIALLPGSRRKEVKLNLPVLVEAAELLRKQGNDLELVLPVASTLNRDWLREEMEEIRGRKPRVHTDPNAALKGRSSTEGLKPGYLAGSERRPKGLLHPTEGDSGAPEGLLHSAAPKDLLHPAEGDSRAPEDLLHPAAEDSGEKAAAFSRKKSGSDFASFIHLTEDARATMMHAHASVVASGTATVEAALSGTPFVVVYRLSPLTWILGRRLVRLDTFAMANLIADKKIVTELIQKDFTAENVVRELNSIIPEGPARQQMQAALKMVQERLHDGKDAEPPALRASREILRFLNNGS
jgi:lipid A disaccharide synthetase